VSEPIVDYLLKNQLYSLIVDAATGNDINDGGLGAILIQMDEQGKEGVPAEHWLIVRKITHYSYWKC